MTYFKHIYEPKGLGFMISIADIMLIRVSIMCIQKMLYVSTMLGNNNIFFDCEHTARAVLGLALMVVVMKIRVAKNH